MAIKKNTITKKASKQPNAAETPKAIKASKSAHNADEKQPASTALEIHINATGRLCFGKAAARIGDLAHMQITIEGKEVRMVAIGTELQC